MTRKFLLRFLHGAWHRILGLTLLGVGSSACGVYLALISKQVVDIATGQAGGKLLTVGVLLGLMIAVQLALQIGITLLHVSTSARIYYGIQSALFDEFLHKEKLAASRFHSGEMVNRLSGDASVVAGGVTDILPSLASVVARVGLSFAALLVLDRVLAVVCVLAGFLMLGAAQIYRKKTGGLFRESRACEGRLRSFIQETVQNLNIIKAFSVYSVLRRQLHRAQSDAYSLTIRKNRISIGANVCFFAVVTAGYYAALAWCAWRLSRGEMTFGTLTAVLGLTGDVTTPFRQLASLFPQYLATCASAERLEELEGLPEDALLPMEEPGPLYDSLSAISLKDVSFTYGEGLVLSHVSAEFPKGQLTAVAGESGAGKSTMLNLICGIYKPETGGVYAVTEAGKKPITSAHRSLFAYVPQEFLLLSGTVLENITLFQEEPDEALVWRVLETAELAEEVKALPEGIHTPLGEGGGRLSGGQRQRMAIARALYSGAQVLLMDESTSALSGGTEEKILQNLRVSGKTVIFVTHRGTAMNLCDRVLKIKDGHIYAQIYKEEM